MKKEISILSIIIIVLSGIASSIGVFSNYSNENLNFISLYGDTITLYGKGIYHHDSVSLALQAVAQDLVTLVVGLPLLIISLYLFRKNLIKGKLLLTGTLGYFLYTYTSYTFYSMYNQLFLLNVTLMSLCFFTFTLTFMTIDVSKIKNSFKDTFPIKLVSSFVLVIGGFIGLMWLGMIINPLIDGTYPKELEHYTTLVIQGMDLGFVVPTSILAGVLLLKKKPFGYVLAPLIIIKGVSMLTAMTAMVINMTLSGEVVSIAFMVLVPIFDLFSFYILYLVLNNIIEKPSLNN
ncbi:hypothetical protein KHQ81_11875 [Mycoplasmatota bacterium]|nr:hypothetical protein KHQ81_11875 [Mycoplasmatota bacterium]